MKEPIEGTRRTPAPMRRLPRGPSYLEFIDMIRSVWTSAAPDIPIVALNNKQSAEYPCIVYYLSNRQVADHTPSGKPEYREEIEDSKGNFFIVTAQKFRNIITFDAYTDNDPEQAEKIIERFESFMLEYGPSFEAMGVPSIRYARRNPDDENNRRDDGVVTRSVSYNVDLEKVISKPIDRFEAVDVEARLYSRPEPAIPRYGDGTRDMNPRYFEVGGANPDFTVEEYDKTKINIPKTNFRNGDVIYLAAAPEKSLPSGLDRRQDRYFVVRSMESSPYTEETAYTLHDYNVNEDELVGSSSYEFESEGEGQVFFVGFIDEDRLS